MTVQEDAAAYEVLEELTTLHPESEYHEDMGDVLWWKIPITEAPWVGSPNCLGQEVLIIASVHTVQGELTPYKGDQQQRVHVGGWPGYHTHWSPLPKVKEPPRHGPPTPRT